MGIRKVESLMGAAMVVEAGEKDDKLVESQEAWPPIALLVEANDGFVKWTD